MPIVETWLVDILAPSIGTALCILMWVSPFPSVHLALKLRNLGNVNPIPYPLMLINCTGTKPQYEISLVITASSHDYYAGWFIYGTMLANPFILCGNIVGILFSTYYTLSLYLLCTLDEVHEDAYLMVMTVIIIGGVGFWLSVRLILCFVTLKTALFTVGLLCAIGAILFYSSPLLKIASVIEKADSSSINPLLAIASFCNCLCWFCYGYFGLNNIWIWLTNGIGIILTIIQIAAFIIFYKPEKVKISSSEDKNRCLEFEKFSLVRRSSSFHAYSESDRLLMT